MTDIDQEGRLESTPLAVLTKAVLDELRPTILRLRRIGWDADVVLDQDEPGLRFVSIRVRLEVAVPVEQAGQL